jgi:catechol 2,3-dioxygenase-like lactoylglutathione lyase family enzyme
MTTPHFDAQITFCGTTDLERAHAFYAETLGLPLALDQGTCRIYRVNDGACLGVCLHDAVAPDDQLILTLVTDDVDDWHERLSGLGVPIEGSPRLNTRYRIYHFFFRDPDGHRLEIQQFEDPQWRSGQPEPA